MTNLRLLRFAAYAAAGPITGPLLAGAYRNFARGDRLLGALYLAAIPAALTLLGVVAAKLGVTALHAL